MKTLIFIFVLLLTTCLNSTIINVPADQPTIQEGINAAVDADTVLVQPGTYVENINYNGKLITVASIFLTTQDTTYISQTIIDGDSLDTVVKFENGEYETAILIGFTITNGFGSGIYCWVTSPSLVNLTISQNNGGGIACPDSSPIIENVTISQNNGHGISCWGSYPSLVNVTISGNSATRGGGIYCTAPTCPSLLNVTIIGNTAIEFGGGIYCEGWNTCPSLLNVTITGNSAGIGGGGIFTGEVSSMDLVNCILWNDSPNEISGSANVTYSDIQGGCEGEGNIDEDPLYTGTGDHPFMLQDLSPCVNVGIPDTTGLNLPEFDLAGNPRIYGGRIDMGAYGGPNAIGWPFVGLDDNIIVQTPEVFLHQNYPNPFNPTTTINYSLKQNSKVSLNVYNIKGQKVKQLISEQLLTGQHSVVWDGKDNNGKSVSSGIYFYKLKTDSFEKTKKMILLK